MTTINNSIVNAITMKIKLIITTLLAGMSMSSINAQDILTLDQAMQAALKNNLSIRAAEFEVESQRSLKGTGFDLPKTSVSLLYGQYNSYAKNDNNITVTQAIPFTVFGSQGKLNRANIASSELKQEVTENELIYQLKQVYLELTYTKARQELLLQQDSIYQGFLKSAALRYKTGETNLLEQTTAQTQGNEVRNQLRQNESQIIALRTQLKTLINSESLPDTGSELTEFPHEDIGDSLLPRTNPTLVYMDQQIEVAKSQKRLEAARFAPDLLIGGFSQTLTGVENTENGTFASSSERFTGFQVGLSVPLWFAPYKSRVRAAEFNSKVAESNYQYFVQTLEGQKQQAIQQYSVAKNSLEYYRTSALPNADLILKQSEAAFKGGEIRYAEYLMGLRNAISIKENYLITLRDYNQSIFYIQYLSGNK
jgi:heavy metal efflux system protein